MVSERNDSPRSDPTTTDAGGLSRRDFVAIAGGIAAAASAGCSDLLGEDGPNGPELSEEAEQYVGELHLDQRPALLLQTPVNLYTENGRGQRGEIDEDLLNDLQDFPIGSIQSDGDGSLVPNTARGWAEATNTIQEAYVETPWPQIPALYATDAVHGHAGLATSTVFPHSTGMGATWDPDLVRQVGEHTATVCRATGVHWAFGPVADVARDHRWGRYYECYSEDPLLTAALVDAKVRGYQGGPDGAGPDSVAATPKHFLGYSEPRGGQDRNPAHIPRRRFLTTHLVPFRAGIEAGAEVVMLNSGSVNGVPVHGSEELVSGLLRDELGFEGLIISDWGDLRRLHEVYGVGETLADAVQAGLDAGIDMIMTGYGGGEVTEALFEIVTDGDEELFDSMEASIRRQLALKERLGLFEDPYVDPDEAEEIVPGADRDLAYETVRKSLTLLRKDGVLPLSGEEAVLVTGPAADSVRIQMGGWTVGWQGVPEDGDEVPPAVTGIDGVEAAAPGGADVTHVPWTLDDGGDEDAVTDAAGDADVAVVFLGEGPYAEGQGDDQRATLGEAQVDLVRAIADADTPVVGVMMAGRPLSIEAIEDDLAAFVMAYLPGTEGGSAIADALYGEVDPGGRLPVTWPAHVGQAPTFYDHLPGEGEHEPTFAFGAGESYGTISHGAPELESTSVEGPALEDTVACTVDVENAGDRPAEDVMIAFAESEAMPGPEIFPVRTVLGFERVALDPGETRSVELSLSVGALAVVGGVRGDGERTVRPGDYPVSIGNRTTTLSVTEADD